MEGNTIKRCFDDSNNGINIFRKIQSGETKLEDAKKLLNIFKSNLNKISRGRFKLGEQKMALKKILNCITNHGKLLLNYLVIILQLYQRLNTKQNTEKD